MESQEDFYFCESGPSSFEFECMKNNGDSYDVIITIGEKHIKAHRIVLSSVIPYFRAMFESRMKESTSTEITLQESVGIDAAMVEHVIDFVYTHTLKVCGDKVPSLFKTSLFLQLENVTSASLEFMWNHINPENVLSFQVYANISNSKCMMENADQYICENFDDVAMSQEFVDILPFSALKQIIMRDDLNALKEEVIFESVIRWVKAYETERYNYLPELLLCVRLPLLSPEYVSTRVSSEQLIQTSDSCRAVVASVTNHYPLDNSSSPNGVTVQKRYCKRKHHLRCSKLMGYGLYSIGIMEDGTFSFNYRDDINSRWNKLCYTSTLKHPEYVACTEDDIYIIYSHILETLNLKTLNSTTVKMIGVNPDCAGIALHNKKLYFMGGIFCSSNLVHCLDPSSGMCSEVNKITKYRTWPGAVSYLENIYVVGGYHENVVHSSGEKFNPTTGQCTKISPMHWRRWGHACSFLGEKLYVCGGNISRGSNNNFNYFTTTCEVYDTLSDQWTLISEMNGIRRSVSLGSFENKLLLLDADPQNQNRFEVETYNEKVDRWRCEESLISSENCQMMAILVTNSATSFLI